MTGLSGVATSVKPVVKKSTTGSYVDGWTSTTSTDTFWLVSQSEIYEKYTEYGLFREEGSSYPWIIANATSTDLDGLDERRDGTDTYSDFHNWWTRSPLIKDNYEWGSVTKDFGCGFYNGAKTSYGVVPCFCF